MCEISIAASGELERESDLRPVRFPINEISKYVKRAGIMKMGEFSMGGGNPRICLFWYMQEAAYSVERARPASLPAPEPFSNWTAVAPPDRRERLRHFPWLQNRAPVAC